MSTKDTLRESRARLFHDTYESLAPYFGYETREDTKEFDPESKNGKLMMKVCEVVIESYLQAQLESLEKILDSYGIDTPYIGAPVLNRGQLQAFLESYKNKTQ